MPPVGGSGGSGGAGPQGPPGNTGPQGSSAITQTTVDFVQPTEGFAVTVQLPNPHPLLINETIYIDGAGYFRVTVLQPSSISALSIVGVGNTTAGTTIPAGSRITPSGVRGAAGAAGAAGANGTNGTNGSFRVLPALDANAFIVWDFQVLRAGGAPPVGAAMGTTVSTGAQTGTNADLSTGFQNNGGGSYAMIGPPAGRSGIVCEFWTGGTTTGGIASQNTPAQPADNSDVTLEVFCEITSLANSTQGVIFSKAFGTTWAAPFNALEINFTSANDGTIEYGMTDSAAPAAEIGGQTSGVVGKVRIGFHVFHLVATGGVLSLYVDGVLRGSVAYTGGVKFGTGPWMIGGNRVNGADSSNIRYSRVAVHSVARTLTEIRNAVKGWLGA